MLTLHPVTARAAEMREIQALYRRAFPANERSSLRYLLRDGTGIGEVLALDADGRFCGFACLLTWGDIAHILYLAVAEEWRGRGYGAAALAALRAHKPGCRLLADLEREDPRAANNAQRARRKRFYLHNGFAETAVRYDWRGESYEILSAGGPLTGEEFANFWRGVAAANADLARF